MANVRGQRTRHFVEGTLDPLVGAFFIHYIKPLAFQIHVVKGMAIMNKMGNAHRIRNRSSRVGFAGRLAIMTITPIQYAAIVIAHNWNSWPPSSNSRDIRHKNTWKAKET